MGKQVKSKGVKLSKIKSVSFREAAPEIPSTTYGTFGLYRYPAKFIPQVVASILKDYSYPQMRVLDPFAGCGTTGLVSRMYGLDYELWDLNPMLKILHSIAIMEPINIDMESFLGEISSSKASFIPSWSRLSYWFPDRILPLLAKVWGYYHSLEDVDAKRLMLVPLLKVTRKFSYNDPQRQKLSRSPRAKQRVQSLLKGNWESKFFSLLEAELSAVGKKILEYQKILPNPNGVQATVWAGLDIIDTPSEIIKKKPWDAVITSPPYLQAQEYIRSSKLDLFWLGYTEEAVRALSKKELPYREVNHIPIYSKTYGKYHQIIKEPHLIKIFENYFHGVLGALTKVSSSVTNYLFLFVGQSSIRSLPIPIDRIFTEHFVNSGWNHESTLVDSIPSRVMFRAKKNPATGLKDARIAKEHLVILKRKA